MDKISPEKLKRKPWHSFQADKSKRSSILVPELLVPLFVIAILCLLKAFIMAAVVGAVAALVIAIRSFSPAGARVIDRLFSLLAYWVGQIVANILLAPAFFFVMPLVRLVNRITGNDPLLLRCPEAPSFWLPSDVESRRTKHARNMFCTERVVGSRLSLVPIAVVALFLLVAAEVGLRIYGFGTPVLYVQDAEVGYYPKPNQRVRAPGRIITVNNHSMRSADLPATKAPGHVRILLLGDSTLMGTWVSNEELYSTLVQDKLNSLAGSPKFEVLNMGVNAWGPFHELAYVKKFGTFDADVAIICGPIYNAYRPGYSLDRLPFNPETHPPRLALEQIAYELAWRFREKTLGAPPWSAGERAEEQCRKGIDAYVELATYLKAHGVEVLFQMLPTSTETLGFGCDEPKPRLMADLTQKLSPLGVPFECAGPVFKDMSQKKKIYHDGVHFDRLGHRLYADYFTDRLIKNSTRVQQTLPPTASAVASNEK